MPKYVYLGGYPDYAGKGSFKTTPLWKNQGMYLALIEGFLRGMKDRRKEMAEEKRYQDERSDKQKYHQDELDWRRSQGEIEAQRQAAKDARDEEEYKRKYVGWTDYGGVDPSSVEIPQMSPPQLDMMERQGEKDWRLAISPEVSSAGQFQPARFRPDVVHPPTEYHTPKPNRRVVTSEGGIYLVDEDTGKIISSKEPAKKPVFHGGGTKKKEESPEKSIAKAYEEINSHANSLMKQVGDGSLPTPTVNRILSENGIDDISNATYEMFQKEARHYLNPFASKVLRDYEVQSALPASPTPKETPPIPPEVAKRAIKRLNEMLPPEPTGESGGVSKSNIVYLGAHLNKRTGTTDHLYRDTATGKTFKGAPPSQNVSMKTSIPGKNIMGGPQMPVGEGDIDPETLRSLRDATTT